MKKTIAVKRPPEDVQKGIARGDYDDLDKVKEMLNDRVIDRIFWDIGMEEKGEAA